MLEKYDLFHHLNIQDYKFDKLVKIKIVLILFLYGVQYMRKNEDKIQNLSVFCKLKILNLFYSYELEYQEKEFYFFPPIHK